MNRLAEMPTALRVFVAVVAPSRLSGLRGISRWTRRCPRLSLTVDAPRLPSIDAGVAAATADASLVLMERGSDGCVAVTVCSSRCRVRGEPARGPLSYKVEEGVLCDHCDRYLLELNWSHGTRQPGQPWSAHSIGSRTARESVGA